jgi:hypothetical protein
MEAQIELIGLRPAARHIACSVAFCGERAAAEMETRPFCQDHFLSVSLQELQSRFERLREPGWDAAATEAFKDLLAAWAREADKLIESACSADPQTKARVLDALLWISSAGKSLRRSPRLATAFPVWLRREDPRQIWEEDTWTSTVSRHGAGFVCRHRLEVGGTVIVTRKDKGGRAMARVVYSRMDSEGRRQVGVQLIDRVDFWD